MAHHQTFLRTSVCLGGRNSALCCHVVRTHAIPCPARSHRGIHGYSGPMSFPAAIAGDSKQNSSPRQLCGAGGICIKTRFSGENKAPSRLARSRRSPKGEGARGTSCARKETASETRGARPVLAPVDCPKQGATTRQSPTRPVQPAGVGDLLILTVPSSVDLFCSRLPFTRSCRRSKSRGSPRVSSRWRDLTWT